MSETTSQLDLTRALVAQMELPKPRATSGGYLLPFYTADQVRECMAQALVRNWQGQAVSNRSERFIWNEEDFAVIREIVINSKHGGFSLSEEGKELYLKLSGKDFPDHEWDIHRDDPDLIEVIRQLGEERAAGEYASLKIIEIPADIDWSIKENGGKEWVAERHRIWE